MLLLLPLCGLSGCFWLTDQERSDYAHLQGGDPCVILYYHNFKTNDPGALNNRTTALTTMPNPNAPPGCKVQTASTNSPGIGVEAVKTVVPALAYAGGEIGAAIAVRPPQFYSNSSTSLQNGTGSTFAGGAGGNGQGGSGFGVGTGGSSRSDSSAAALASARQQQGQGQWSRNTNNNSTTANQTLGAQPQPQGPQSFYGNGHRWDCVPGQGCVDP